MEKNKKSAKYLESSVKGTSLKPSNTLPKEENYPHITPKELDAPSKETTPQNHKISQQKFTKQKSPQKRCCCPYKNGYTLGYVYFNQYLEVSGLKLLNFSITLILISFLTFAYLISGPETNSSKNALKFMTICMMLHEAVSFIDLYLLMKYKNHSEKFWILNLVLSFILWTIVLFTFFLDEESDRRKLLNYAILLLSIYFLIVKGILSCCSFKACFVRGLKGKEKEYFYHFNPYLGVFYLYQFLFLAKIFDTLVSKFIPNYLFTSVLRIPYIGGFLVFLILGFLIYAWADKKCSVAIPVTAFGILSVICLLSFIYLTSFSISFDLEGKKPMVKFLIYLSIGIYFVCGIWGSIRGATAWKY